MAFLKEFVTTFLKEPYIRGTSAQNLDRFFLKPGLFLHHFCIADTLCNVRQNTGDSM